MTTIHIPDSIFQIRDSKTGMTGLDRVIVFCFACRECLFSRKYQRQLIHANVLSRVMNAVRTAFAVPSFAAAVA